MLVHPLKFFRSIFSVMCTIDPWMLFVKAELFTGWMTFLSPIQQHQSNEGN